MVLMSSVERALMDGRGSKRWWWWGLASESDELLDISGSRSRAATTNRPPPTAHRRTGKKGGRGRGVQEVGVFFQLPQSNRSHGRQVKQQGSMQPCLP